MRNFRNFLVLVVNCLLANQVNAGIKISEVMPCNISTYMDKGSDGIDPDRSYNFPGWVEFYNDGDETSFKGYTISHCKFKKGDTNMEAPELKWRYTIEEEIKIGEEAFQILFFDGDTEFYKHMPYKLDSDGGSITLYKGSEKIDSFVYKAMETHISYGRDGSSEGYMNPTPKTENSTAYSKYSDRVRKPKFDGCTPGVVSGTVRISLSCAEGKTYYTMDGSEPIQDENMLYNGSIEIDETTVFKARTFNGDKPASEILTGTFLYMDKYHSECGGFTVPIICVSTNEEYLYDEEIGFLLKEGSKNGREFPDSDCLRGMGKVNVLQEHWNRPVVVEYIEDGKVTMVHETEAGIMGGCSRGWKVASLKLKAGSKVGSSKKEFSFTHGTSPFKDKPNNKYTSFHLRNGGNAGDTGSPDQIRVRDGFMQSLTKNMGIDYQAFQTVAYYLNGKYQGLMGLRERTNEDYVEANYGLDDEETDVLKTNNDIGVVASNGTTDWYDELIDYVKSNDPKSETFYNTVCKYMDMDEYIDYQIFEHFIVNTDWVGNNTKMWRDHKNGKLRWIVYDTDFGLGLYPHNNCYPHINTFEFATGGEPHMWSNDEEWKVILFKRLTKNPQFREKFVNNTLIHLGSTFQYDTIVKVWEEIKEEAENEYCAFKKRYDTGSTALGAMSGVKNMLAFAKERPDRMYDHIESFFNVDLVDFKLTSNIDNAQFRINGDMLNASSMQSKQVSDKQLRIVPIAPAGYKFKEWEIQDNAGEMRYVTKDAQWKYFYEKENPTGEWAAIDYDDSEWLDGQGKMGYKVKENSESYNTVLDFGEDEMKKPVRAYFRTTFDVENPNAVEQLDFSATYDDGFIVYINGKEVYRKNINDSLGAGEEIAKEQVNDPSIDFSIESSEFELVAGKNVLAIVLCQNNSESGDMTLRFTMTAERKTVNGVRKQEEPIYNSYVSGSVTLKAIFEECDCNEIFAQYSELVMNEVAPSNDATTDVVDEYGIHSDWFEIYNPTDKAIDLAGLYLSDDENNIIKSLIPFTHPDSTVIEPKGFVRFWADNATYRGPLHADFKLSNTGRNGVYLSAKCGNSTQPIAHLTYKDLPQNASLGYLCNDASGEPVIFDGSSSEINDSIIIMNSTPASSNPPCEDTCNVIFREYKNLKIYVLYPNNDNPDENWYGIINEGDNPVELENLYLTDDPSNLGKSPINFSVLGLNSTTLGVSDSVKCISNLTVNFEIPNKDSSVLYLSYKCGDEYRLIYTFRYDFVEQNGSTTEITEEVISQNRVQLYPNPTDAAINITSEGADIISVNVYDATGRMLISEEINEEVGQVDMSDLAKGTYYLQIITTQEVLQHKVLKK